MQTQFKPDNTVNATLMELPIMKHFDQTDIAKNFKGLKKGEVGIYNILKLLIIGAFGYLTWVYVLPPIFKAIGQFSAVIATGGLLVLAVLCAPAIFKLLKNIARKLHKAVINQDPFAELALQRKKMVDNQQVFRISKGKIQALKSDMEVEANNSEADAKLLQNKIISLQAKATKLKSDLDAMLAKGGAKARESDEFINGNSDLLKILSESSRVANKLAQDKNFVQKYGARAAIMKKFAQKMVMVETSMEIKIADFDATVEMLKKDFDFGQNSRQATDAVKSAMLFTKSWELDYALNVVTSTIASDIATTAGNLRDIDTLTSQYAVDSDDLYANLNTLADNIKTGTDDIPSAKQYNNPDYQLTASDKLKSGGFQDLF